MEGTEKSLDLDPIYLLKQGEEWKVMPGLDDWQIAKSVAKDKVDAFEKLETWFKQRKAELKKTTKP